MKKNAFTLLEILVVISIIGILVALGTAAFTTAQKKGRDARRQADIKAMQNGFEQFNSREGRYPLDQGEAGDVIIFPAGLPEDPKNSGDNVYYFNLDASIGSTYCICASLESTPGNSSSTHCSYEDGDYYCLSNLQ